jgi:hypothetical protein
MTELVFDCVDACAERYAVAPTLSLTLRIAEISGIKVDAIALRVQIRVLPHLRRYSGAESARLVEVFGDPSRWADTVKPMQFALLTAMVPGFAGSVELDLPVPCTYDLEIAHTKYFNALDTGDIPLLLLFSGTVFTTADNGRMRVYQVPWSKESAYRLPVTVWREMMDLHFPDASWLTVSRETLDALQRFKSANALPTWDSAIMALLDRIDRERAS